MRTTYNFLLWRSEADGTIKVSKRVFHTFYDYERFVESWLRGGMWNFSSFIEKKEEVLDFD